MGTTPLRRTVRRCVALLLVPNALLLAVVSRYLASPYGPGAPLDVLTVGAIVGLFLAVAAVGYLGLSAVLAAGTSTDVHESENERELGA